MLQRKGHTPEAVRATVGLAGRPEAAEPEAATAQGLVQERAEQVPERAQVAEPDLVGEQAQAARARDRERERVLVPALQEEPARAQGRDPRVPAEMAAQAWVAETRAAAEQARNSLAGVDRVQAAVPEVATAAAPELALCWAMKVATAPGVAQVSVAKQRAAEMPGEARPEAVAEEGALVSANQAKRGSTAFCER